MSAVMTDWINRHLITADEFHRMDEAGIFAPDARVELIEGVIIDMGKIGPGHAWTTVHLTRLLIEAVGARVLVLPQVPIHLSDISEPIPDFALVSAEVSYKKGHPGPEHTLLVIEISDSTLRQDIQVKAPLYARHGIPEYWIIDLPGRQIRFFRSPDSGQYTDITSTDSPGVISPVALPEVHIDLVHVLDD